MIRRWFLRLVPEIGVLQASVEQLTQEKLRLEDRLESALNDRDRLWSLMQEALGNERASLRMQINHAVQRSGGGVPYPEEHSLPVENVRKPQEPGPLGRRGRVLPSELAARQSRENMLAYVENMNTRVRNG